MVTSASRFRAELSCSVMRHAVHWFVIRSFRHAGLERFFLAETLIIRIITSEGEIDGDDV